MRIKGLNCFVDSRIQKHSNCPLGGSYLINGILLMLSMAIAALSFWLNVWRNTSSTESPCSPAPDEMASNLNIKIALTVILATEIFSLSTLILDRDPMPPVVESIFEFRISSSMGGN